jgi:hypothetical protein
VHARIAEAVISGTLKFMCEERCDFNWSCYQLSNGGFYMAPELERLKICVAGNGFNDFMSADAAGMRGIILERDVEIPTRFEYSLCADMSRPMVAPSLLPRRHFSEGDLG